ncbi:glycosyltransferase family 4 protein [Parvibaculum sp.]|uniref:glycosyltransferase family 4 protein n=1 Tax=Parvibaculum sp. TaxID=2024848 RepID=UPI00349FE3D4
MKAAPSAASALLVTQYYRPELIGSAPFCGDVAEWLRRHGVPVEVLTSRPHYPGNEVFADYRSGERDLEILNNVPVTRLPTRAPRNGGAVQRIASAGYFLAQGLKTIAQGGVARREIVVSLSPSILAVILGNFARARNGRHIVIVHDIESGLAQGLGIAGGRFILGLLRKIEGIALNRADLILVLSEEMKAQLEARGVRRPIGSLPIWIDTERIRPLPAPQGQPLTLLYSGNFGRKQSLHQVLALAGILKRSDPDIRLVLRGDGREAEALTGCVKEAALDNIQFSPLVPPERLNEALAEGDIHLVPQDPQGADFAVPSKIFCIMAAGRPFVATAVPGSQIWRLQAESEAFFCVPPDQPEVFAAAVRQLAADETLRAELGARGRAYVEAHHTKAKILRDFMMAATGSEPGPIADEA